MVDSYRLFIDELVLLLNKDQDNRFIKSKISKFRTKLTIAKLREYNIYYIWDFVCDYFDIPKSAILSKSRKPDIVIPRQIIMFYSKSITNLTLAEIGEILGNKDHATVLHAVKTINNYLSINAKVKLFGKEVRIAPIIFNIDREMKTA